MHGASSAVARPLRACHCRWGRRCSAARRRRTPGPWDPHTPPSCPAPCVSAADSGEGAGACWLPHPQSLLGLRGCRTWLHPCTTDQRCRSTPDLWNSPSGHGRNNAQRSAMRSMYCGQLPDWPSASQPRHDVTPHACWPGGRGPRWFCVGAGPPHVFVPLHV